jgi:RNA polymerase sigma-70 factor, ECF subfamily
MQMTATEPNVDVTQELGPLLRYAMALTRDRSEAEELVQDALVRAFAKRETYDPSRSLRAWLFAILHNVFVSGRRRRHAEQRRHSTAARQNPVDTPPDQEHAAELMQVQAAFAALSAEHRAVLHLIAVEGWSYQDAASALEIPIGTVMSRLSRARAGLRALLNDEPAAGHGTRPYLRIVGGSDEP